MKNISLYKLLRDKNIYEKYLTYNIVRKFNGYILTDLLIPVNSNKIVKIDLLLINSKGVFVVDSKYYKGSVYGLENSRKWLQILKNNKRNKFYSPILQNNTNIKSLNNVIKEVDKNNIYSIIVFNQSCQINKIDFIQDRIKVINRTYLYDTIQFIIKSNIEVFDSDEINLIYSKLLKYKIESKKQEKNIEKIK